MPRPRPRTLLIFSQTFVPDPAAVGQQMADLAVAMSRRGHRVIVYASARGYENPRAIYPRRENLQGAQVRRLPFASFGKKNMLLRVAGTFSFMLQCLIAGLFTPDVDAIFFSTSPPLIGIVATLIHVVRGAPFAYWAMDLNPDQLIALGKLHPRSATARFLEAVNRLILREASLVVALDRFMAERLDSRVNLRGKMEIVPPWPHEEHLHAAASSAPESQETDWRVAHRNNPFRLEHGLDGKFVVMYSGNHSPSNPLTTLLEAAVRLRDRADVVFVFVGGGAGKRDVENLIRDHSLSNVLSLPYQPLSQLRDCLSAADVHVVALGEKMIGIIHPCKIYGAMSVARPILYFGPSPSHITEILESHDIGRHITHADVEGAVTAIESMKALSPEERSAMGQTALRALRRDFSQETLRTRLCECLERLLQRRKEQSPQGEGGVTQRKNNTRLRPRASAPPR